MSNTAATDFLQQHAPDGNLSAEQAAQFLELSLQGDTGTAPDNGGAPDTAPDADPGTERALSDANGNAVILAKDGVHTIPYAKLSEAREAERHWKAQATAYQQELESLRAAAAQRQEAGIAPTLADQQSAAAEAAIEAGVDPAIFGDFSEEAIARGIEQVVEQRVSKALAQMDSRLQQSLAPILGERQTAQIDAHEQAILAAHPDIESLVESQQLTDWMAAEVAKLPSFQQAAARAAFDAVLDSGTAAEVIELFDAFKASTGAGQPAAAVPPGMQAAARAVIEASRPGVPASLSDFPGAASTTANGFESAQHLNAPELIDRFANWSPEKIEAFLNSQ